MHKILSLKEEGDSPHTNQAYSIFVAKGDKAMNTESLGMMRNIKYENSCVVDQWGLMHVGLYAIQSTKQETWTVSFDACYLNPRT